MSISPSRIQTRFLIFPFDPAHTGNAIITPYTDMICTHHKISKSELFIGPFLR